MLALSFGAVVHGPDGVNDLLTRQMVGAGDLCVARVTAVQGLAFVVEPISGGAMDCAVYAAATQEGLIGCVHDGINLEFGDVGSDETNLVVVRSASFGDWRS